MINFYHGKKKYISASQIKLFFASKSKFIDRYFLNIQDDVSNKYIRSGNEIQDILADEDNLEIIKSLIKSKEIRDTIDKINFFTTDDKENSLFTEDKYLGYLDGISKEKNVLIDVKVTKNNYKTSLDVFKEEQFKFYNFIHFLKNNEPCNFKVVKVNTDEDFINENFNSEEGIKDNILEEIAKRIEIVSCQFTEEDVVNYRERLIKFKELVNKCYAKDYDKYQTEYFDIDYDNIEI